MSMTELKRKMLGYKARSDGPGSVLATRVWLSRNLEEHFSCRLDEKERRALHDRLFASVADCSALADGHFFALSDLELHERRFLAEAALIPAVAQNGCDGTGLIFARDPRLSLFIAGEDHLRIQCLREGLLLHRAFACADSLDMALEERFEFAFSEEFGYLTASPQLAGTGMRASVIMHLPALAISEELPRIFRGLRALNFNVLQPVEGEGHESGALIEISNLRSLGRSEMSFLEALRGVAGKLDEFEARARESLLHKAQCLLEDRIWSAYGQLRHGRIMSEARAMAYLGDLRLGCLTEIVQSVSLQEVQDMWLRVQDGYLQAAAGRALEDDERDRHRADRLREWLAGGEVGSIGKDKLA